VLDAAAITRMTPEGAAAAIASRAAEARRVKQADLGGALGLDSLRRYAGDAASRLGDAARAHPHLAATAAGVGLGGLAGLGATALRPTLCGKP
jgi:hypothetical protein